MSLTILFAILILHWFADFVLQTDWQAKNKSSNNVALTSHVTRYSLVWLFASAIFSYATGNYLMLLFPIVTFICHWITDYFTSRLNTKLWQAGRVHDFFVSIGFDQILHYVQLILTFILLV